jgi:hypothetical protein
MKRKERMNEPNRADLTSEAARKVIEAADQKRVAACLEELEALLKKRRCRMEVSILLKAGQVIPQLQIVAE